MPAVAARAQSNDAGVRDHDVQAAELGESVGHHLFDGVGVAHVGLTGDDASALLLDELDGLVKILGTGIGVVDGIDVTADVERNDVRAVRRESHRMRATLASSRSGDEGDFAVQISMGLYSSISTLPV